MCFPNFPCRFNPLHCGAVVASPPRREAGACMGEVSIPFIAGQWSLRAGRGALDSERRAFQSPSLRGSGRFTSAAVALVAAAVFQSPSLRGSGRFASASCPCAVGRRVSIPFIAGQWSLPAPTRRTPRTRRKFQSPSLRGSGRFRSSDLRVSTQGGVSIPFIAGQWSLQEQARKEAERARDVSIPFIAGQWSLQKWISSRLSRLWRFNPLHCGAVVASARGWPRPPTRRLRFNPLHCGAVVASRGLCPR